MSIQFGVLYPEGRNVARPELAAIASATDRYAEDGCELKVHGRVGMGFQPFHTHQRSRLGGQPMTTDGETFLHLMEESTITKIYAVV